MNDILQRAQACIESDGRAFEYKLNPSRKDLIVIFFSKCPTLDNTKNIITI